MRGSGHSVKQCSASGAATKVSFGGFLRAKVQFAQQGSRELWPHLRGSIGIEDNIRNQAGADGNQQIVATVLNPLVAAWRRAWDRVIPFFAFPPAVRRVIYTTNAIESINAQLRKIIKTRGHFPSDDAATKLIWLALRNITADWGRAAHHWKEAMNQFAILYEERFTQATRHSA